MHKSYPKHTTIHDLVQACPGCGGTVSLPYTQDPFRELRQGRPPQLYKATDEELEIIKGIVPDCVEAFSVGTKINTLQTKSGKLWHEPCYVLAEVMEFRRRMQDVVNILHRVYLSNEYS